jgi:hypothetical protein
MIDYSSSITSISSPILQWRTLHRRIIISICTSSSLFVSVRPCLSQFALFRPCSPLFTFVRLYSPLFVFVRPYSSLSNLDIMQPFIPTALASSPFLVFLPDKVPELIVTYYRAPPVLKITVGLP